ncbi:hypothetical protein F5I97DRAFT_577375 [Phlebopus sp. FC_14]|nr:hypothetical protein F5I97DRAFT_577375 [Phlebopus sp. FC_14]
MSMYKTQRCRYFDESGHSLKPYCTQGDHCRFIHPNDPQWERVKSRYDMATENHEKMKVKSRNKPHALSVSPPRVNMKTLCDSGTAIATEGHFYGINASVTLNPGSATDDEVVYPNQRQRKSENNFDGFASRREDTRSNPTRGSRREDQVELEPADLRAGHILSKMAIPDIFCRLAKLCREISQDACILDREEEKLKAFTELSSDLSNAAPTTAMAVIPALASVITSHAKCKDGVEQRIRELDSLWSSLFSALEDDISKLISSRLHDAIATLHKKRDDICQSLAHTAPLKRKPDEPRSEMQSSHEPSSWKNSAADGRKTYSERSAVSVDTDSVLHGSPGQKRRRISSLSVPMAKPAHEVIGTDLKEILAAMRLQMDKQTRAIEHLAKENHKPRYTSHCSPVPSDSCASSRI